VELNCYINSTRLPGSITLYIKRLLKETCWMSVGGNAI